MPTATAPAPDEGAKTDPAIAQVAEHAAAVVDEAAAITITDADSYQDAAAFLTGTLKPMLRELAETFGPMKRKALDAHREIVAQEKRHREPLEEAERIVKRALGVYDAEQRRLAAEAEAARIAEAKKAAEDEAVEQAARLEDAGHAEAAEERIARPPVPVVSTPAPEPAKAAGVSTRTVSKFRIIDAGKIGRAYLTPDEKKIGQVVRAMGADAAELVGGIEVYEETVVAARSTR